MEPQGRLPVGAQETTSISALQPLPRPPSLVAPEPEGGPQKAGRLPLPRGPAGNSVRLREPTANCGVTFEILLHGGFAFRMLFKVIHSLSRSCQWWSPGQLVINHRSGLKCILKKREKQKAVVEKEKKRNPLQGRGGNQYLRVLETLGMGMAGGWPSPFLPKTGRWSAPAAASARLDQDHPLPV